MKEDTLIFISIMSIWFFLQVLDKTVRRAIFRLVLSRLKLIT